MPLSDQLQQMPPNLTLSPHVVKRKNTPIFSCLTNTHSNSFCEEISINLKLNQSTIHILKQTN